MPVYFVGVERGVHYYAMQLIQGSSLARVLERWRGDANSRSHSDDASAVASADDTPHSLQAFISTKRTKTSDTYWRQVATLGIQVAEAVEHAHSQGMVHRDIKPGNLLLDEDQQAWVTDFGLAHLEAEASTRSPAMCWGRCAT